MSHVLYCVALVFSISIAVAQPAHAYLDPGTGSIILQSLIGAVAAGLVLGRTYLYQVKGWLGLLPKRDENAERPSE
ncbi:MAG: hypothetical protein K0R53_3414 [Burkholderiales bacterium]|jgi:hypothetical protein|nr:hypothetical protein [Burkholderiales bacterium]